MKNRRQFLKMTAGAAVLGAFGVSRRVNAQQSAEPPYKVWVLSDLHCGLQEGGKDGKEWYDLACQDMVKEHPDIAFAMVLGDIAHKAKEEEYQDYIKLRDASALKTWYEIAGNHEYSGKSSEVYQKLIRKIDPYTVVRGNLVWICISDEKPGVQGDLTDGTCDWMEAELEKHKDKNIIVCSHQGVKDTTYNTEKKDRHLHPPERVAGMLDKYKIDLWLSGHEHHTPYTPKHIARVGETTFINVASMNHAYKTGASQSCLLEFVTGEKQVLVRRREHDKRQFLPEFETVVPLRHAVVL